MFSHVSLTTVRIAVERQVAGRSHVHGEHVRAEHITGNDYCVVRDGQHGRMCHGRAGSHVLRFDGGTQDRHAGSHHLRRVREIRPRGKRSDNDLVK